MFRNHRVVGVLLAAFTAALLVPALAAAQDRDAQEVASYKLTEAGLAKYTQATRKLAALAASKPGACDEDDEESDSQSLDQIVAKFEAVPGVKAAIQSAGMTTREYLVFSLSILQNGLAAWALSEPGGKLPPGVSKANVDFYKQHEAELKSLGELDNDACEEEPGDDESQE